MNEPLTRYLSRLIEDFRRLDSRGVMQMARIVEMDLREVFIPLKLKLELPEKESHFKATVFPDSPISASISEGIKGQLLWRFPAANRADVTLDELLARPGLGLRSNRWVILGDPGAGKTTLLRHRAIQAPRALLADPAAPEPFPIFITLRYFGEWLAKHPAHEPGDALLDYWVEEGLAEFGLTELADRQAAREAIENKLRTGWVLFLLDGLDEQRDSATKTNTAEAIRALDQRCHGNTWLVTSRIVGYGGVLGGLFEEATAQPFTPEDRNAYLRQWFLAVEQREDPVYLLAQCRGEAAEPDEYTRQTAQRKADALIEQIDDIAGIRELAANPLLCTIVGLIFLQGGTLPDSRAELYKLCVDTFIFNWEMHKRRKPQDGPQLNKEETQAVLEAVALHFHEHCPENRAGRAALVDRVENFLVKECGETSAAARAKAEHLLALITEVAGLLIDRGNDEYGFFHLSFQEYLAARRITASRRRWKEYLSRYCFDPRWREVIRLAAIHQGSKDTESGSEFVEAVWYLQPAPPHDDIMQYRFRFAFLLMREARVEREAVEALWQHWSELFWKKRKLDFLWTSLLWEPGKAPAVPEVILERFLLALADGDSEMRQAAAQVLSWMKEPRAVGDLLRALADEASEVRQAAAWALGQIKEPKAVDDLLRMLADEASEVRQAAAQALGWMKEPRAVDGLLRALADEASEVRQAAAWVLGQIKEPKAVDDLLRMLADEASGVRQAAAQALIWMKEPRAVDDLLQMLVDEDSGVRRTAAQVLGEMKEPRAVDDLLQMLGDEASEVRQAAAYALGEIKEPKVVDGLLRALGDEDSDVRQAAAYALNEIKEPKVVDGLLRALGDEDSGVRQAAAYALGEIKEPKVVDGLLRALGDEDSDVRQAAAYALGEIKEPKVVDGLLRALGDEDSEVRFAAASSVEKLDLGTPL